MLHDDFEHDIAASMDDLETIDTITIPPPPTVTALTTSKLAKFKRLPEIVEDSSTDATPTSSSSDLLFRVSNDVMAASMGGDLRKTVLINNSANEILSSSMLNVTPVDDIDINADHDSMNNNFTNGNKIVNEASSPVQDNNNTNIGSTITTGTRRKFIVTRMDSNALLLRPEAEHLRHLTAKTNAATISFPCSSASNRAPLSSIFSANTSFEPHLDRRFFDTSLVRINANSTQSLNVSNNNSNGSHSHYNNNNSIKIDADIWERRKDLNDKHVQVVVSSMSQMILNDILYNPKIIMICYFHFLRYIDFRIFIISNSRSRSMRHMHHGGAQSNQTGQGIRAKVKMIVAKKMS